MSTPPNAYLGRTLAGRYSLTRLIGRGGMGLVYLALDQWSGQDVVVKLLAPHWADDPEALDRFEREGVRLASLRHPNIVQFFGYGEDAGERFIAMEYIRGESLRHFLRRQDPLSLRVFAPIAAQILAGASYAHHQNLMLRDIKPSNIMLTEQEGRSNFVKLLDFGLARFAEGHEAEITKSYAVGTAGYLAPELIRGERGDLRVDVYALGVLFFRMLTGESPIVGDNDGALLYNHVHSEPRALSSWLPQPHDIPDALVALISRCLAKDPRERPVSAAEIHDHLLACVPTELFVLPPASPQSRQAIAQFEQQHQTGKQVPLHQSGDTWKRAQVGATRRRPTVLMGPPPPPTASGEYESLRGRVPLAPDDGVATRVGRESFEQDQSPMWAGPPPAPMGWSSSPAQLAPDEVEVELDDAEVDPTVLVQPPRKRSLVPVAASVGSLGFVALGLVAFVVWSHAGPARTESEPAPTTASVVPSEAQVLIEAPPLARIRVDDRPVVIERFSAPLPTGSHRVEVEAEGFAPWSLEFEVIGGMPLTFKPTLRRLPPPPKAPVAAPPLALAPEAERSTGVSRKPATPRSESKRAVVRSRDTFATNSSTPTDSTPSTPPKSDTFVIEKEQTSGVFLPVGKP